MIKTKHLILILILAAIVRLVYISILENKWYYFDTAHYDHAAQSIISGNGFGSSLHYYNKYQNYCLEPGYPIFLAFIYMIFGVSLLAVRVAQVLLSILHLFFIYKITGLLSPGAAKWALVFGAFYPFFIYISGLLYVTQLFALLLTISIYFFLKYYKHRQIKWFIFASIFLSLTISTRPVALPVAMVLFFWILFLSGGSIILRIRQSIIFVSIIILLLLPWMIRNYQLFGTISPGRACFSETSVFNNIQMQWKRDDIYKSGVFSGKKFVVEINENSTEYVFRCFLDDSLIAKIYPDEKISLGPTFFYGFLVRGGEPTHLDKFAFKSSFDESDSNGLSNQVLQKYISSDKLKLVGNKLEIDESKENWDKALIYQTPAFVRRFEMVYPDFSKPENVERFAFFISSDGAALDASGYMIWLHPYGMVDLYRVKNGRPAYAIKYRDISKEDEHINAISFIAQNPVRYITSHFIPEFLTFWSPFVTRVKTANAVTFTMQILSFITFAPILFSSFFGFFSLRKKYKIALLIIIPPICISLFYAIYFSQTRFRIPIDGFLIILAAIGVSSYSAQLKKYTKKWIH